MGMGWAAFSLVQMRHKDKMIDVLFEKNKSLDYKYNVINTWVFAADKHIKLNGLKGGNSIGDVMLDWDGVPEQILFAEKKDVV